MFQSHLFINTNINNNLFNVHHICGLKLNLNKKNF